MKWHKWFLFVILIVTAATAANWYYHTKAMERFDEYETLMTELDMTTMTSTWLSGGVSRTITSNRRTSEALDVFLARHKSEVVQAQTLFPLDG